MLVALNLLRALPVAAATSGSGDNAGPHKWALLIGVEDYQKASKLRYTADDVKQLGATLRQRGGYQEDDITQIFDSDDSSLPQPMRAALLEELPKFLAKPGPEDHVLVYFSGHGFRDKAGKLYLAPLDCDPANPEPTGIAVEWFRQQLADCKAKFKLLVLDACHAGTDKGEGEPSSVSAEDLGKPFRDLKGSDIFTIASSGSDEKSQIWDEKKQSLFSYWLNQGLKGHADTNGDGIVTVDELFGYVHHHVTQTVKSRSMRPQTPVRIVGSGVIGVPEVVRVMPQGLKPLLHDIAEQLAWSLEERQLKKVGVLEFTNDTKLGELLGGDFGVLGRYCAGELERQLGELGGNAFGVVDQRRLQTALKSQGFGLKDLGSDEAIGKLSKAADGMPVIALGTLRDRSGHVITLQCKLVQTQQDDIVGSAAGTANLNESEWAMIGRSAWMKDRPALTLDRKGGDNLPIGAQQISQWDRLAKEDPHPLRNPEFPYRVKIMVKKQPGSDEVVEAQSMFRRTSDGGQEDMCVGLRKGDVYKIYIENRDAQPVMMRLLVDGLNTLPEKTLSKALYVEGKEPEGEYKPAQRVNLAEALAWQLDPHKLCAVPGFFSKTGADGKYNEFKVVDAQQSVAARQAFTDQIGIITAAFYRAKRVATSRGVEIGTGFGKEYHVHTEEYKDLMPGDLLGVVHIRYIEPEMLKAEP
jgi:uncharacterized caspase-like protein